MIVARRRLCAFCNTSEFHSERGLHHELGRRPATHRRIDVSSEVIELRRQHPRAGTDRLAALLIELLEEDRRLLLDAGRFLVDRVLAVAETRKRMSRAAPAPRERAARKVAERVEVAKVVAKVKEVAILDMLVDGKPLRLHIGAEVARLGNGFVKLAQRVPADAYVGEIICEKEARELLGGPV